MTAYAGLGHTGSMGDKHGHQDLNTMAASIVKAVTSIPHAKPAAHSKDPAAVALGRKGGLKGGKARALKLSAKKRKAIAQKAAKARWGKRSGA